MTRGHRSSLTVEQVRLLNPIDEATHTEHRLLVTTRIRDLVPKATQVELPLMGQDEAVALLLDLANVEEASYRKEHPESAWPPQVAYTIAAECGLLPITLTIAAQVVRSWGEGWEGAVLPLLREQQGAQGTSSIEGRVIGAGLQAIDRSDDGTATKELFHMFGVTQEDFIYPMAVVEMLWRSCCASELNDQERSLTARLKYLRKRLTAEELRAEQQKVVEGMVAAAAERFKATGRGLQDTGKSDKPFAGEEIDWYCNSCGAFHMRATLDEMACSTVQSEDLRRWLLLEDSVLWHQASSVMGPTNLQALANEYEEQGLLFEAAKMRYMGAYFRSIEAFSADDNFEGLFGMAVIPSLVGNELAPLSSFRSRILHIFKLAGFETADEFRG
eukprot:g2286.t1